jgi:hypothetical protein
MKRDLPDELQAVCHVGHDAIGQSVSLSQVLRFTFYRVATTMTDV